MIFNQSTKKLNEIDADTDSDKLNWLHTVGILGESARIFASSLYKSAFWTCTLDTFANI